MTSNISLFLLCRTTANASKQTKVKATHTDGCQCASLFLSCRGPLQMHPLPQMVWEGHSLEAWWGDEFELCRATSAILFNPYIFEMKDELFTFLIHSSYFCPRYCSNVNPFKKHLGPMWFHFFIAPTILPSFLFEQSPSLSLSSFSIYFLSCWIFHLAFHVDPFKISLSWW